MPILHRGGLSPWNAPFRLYWSSDDDERLWRTFNNVDIRVLKVLLHQGLDVDRVCDFSTCPKYCLHHFWPRTRLRGLWKLTLLDCLYYEQGTLDHYNVTRSYSSRTSTPSDRGALCLATRLGPESLSAFLSNRAGDLSEPERVTFLEIVLAEQFIRCNLQPDWQVITGLIDYGADPNLTSLGGTFDIQLLLHLTIISLSRSKPTDQGVAMMYRLLINGALLNEQAVVDAVVSTGTVLLKAVEAAGANIKEDGSRALARAVSLGNADAVDWLLQRGVDPRAEFLPHRWSPHRVTILLAALDGEALCSRLPCGDTEILGPRRRTEPQPQSLELTLQLLEQGFPYRCQLADDDPDVFLRLFTKAMSACLKSPAVCFSAMRRLHAAGVVPCDYSSLLSQLASAKNWTVFECVLEHASIGGKSDLITVVIRNKAPESLIQRVIHMTTSQSLPIHHRQYHQWTSIPTAVSIWEVELLGELIARGATLVDIPSDRSAEEFVPLLERACEGKPLTASEAEAQLNTVRFLLNHGVPVNGVPSRKMALLIPASKQGNLELVLLLLERGADPPQQYEVSNALGLAVKPGRLDFVQVLINAGALLCNCGPDEHRGEGTRYDWAIEDALYDEHFETAKLLYRLATLIGHDLHGQYPELSGEV